MKKVSLLLLSFISFFLGCWGSSEITSQKLFAIEEEGYDFKIIGWSIEETKENAKRINVTIRYKIPEKIRINIYISKSRGDFFVGDDILNSVWIDSKRSGEFVLSFDDETKNRVYYIGMWRGLSREISPSGITVPGSYLDFTPKIINTFK